MSDNRARIWFALFVLAVFCLGGAGGFFAGRFWPGPPGWPGRPGVGMGPDGRGFGRGSGGMARGNPQGGPGRGRGLMGPPPLPPDLINRLSSELQLDANQQTQVTRILDERRDRLEAVHRDARERFDKEQRELRDAIRGVLHPDQMDRFNRFFGGGQGSR
jgi:hypothetical protein